MARNAAGADHYALTITLWHLRMPLHLQNPRILDTAAVISRSNTQLIAAQMAAGQLPPSTKLDGRHATQLSLPRPASAAPGGELVPIEQANALVPAGTTIDALLLQQPPPAGVVAWGPRPSENSPYDQLVLHNPDEEFMLSRNELVELFARHRADPSVWTPARLAELYATKPEWVEAILETAAPPIVCTVDGDLYGEQGRAPNALLWSLHFASCRCV